MNESANAGQVAKPDDWDQHWSQFGDQVDASSPANGYRRRLVSKLLGRPAPGATIVDAGSGQGQLTMYLQGLHPECHVVGIEYSAEGVRRARAAAAASRSTARFIQRDLLEPGPVDLPDGGRASQAVCSEVLEHVDRPEVMLANIWDYLSPGSRIVVTVPGGPRSALDRHIGHRRHYRAKDLAALLDRAGFDVLHTYRAGFPFFNLYRLVVIARGKRLISDLRGLEPDERMSWLSRALFKVFDLLFHLNLDHTPFGWQILAVATPNTEGRV